jgi:cold shock CspA family protein
MNQKLYLANASNGQVSMSPGINSERPRLRGTAATGRIVKLVVGQGHGFIRLADRREIYFHRGDLKEGTPFNGFRVGDSVEFELLEDRFSGARALQVRRHER